MNFCWPRKPSVASSLARIASKILSAARSKAVDPLTSAPFLSYSSSSSFVPLIIFRAPPFSSYSSPSFVPLLLYRAKPLSWPHRQPRWYQDTRAVFIVVVVGGATVATVYYANLETVPYSKRRHFILLSPAIENQLGEIMFRKVKSELRGEILPPLHPYSIRLRRLCKEIVYADQRGLPHNGGEEGTVRGSEPSMEGFNWEVLVVRSNEVNAFCFPGGKIVVFTGLLNYFRSDAEIATVIGHEVGHIIARHSAEIITKTLSLAIIVEFIIFQLIIFQFFAMPDVIINGMSNLVLRFLSSHRNELEADYIGFMLLALAGYDPRVAPLVYKKLGKIARKSRLTVSTHPSGAKRAQCLTQVMEEALAIRARYTGKKI